MQHFSRAGTRTTALVALGAALASATAGCRGGDGFEPDPGFALTLSATSLAIGDSAQALVSAGEAWVIPAAWSSSDTNVVRVGPNGWFSAVGVGSATITANSTTLRGRYAMAPVTVVPRSTSCHIVLLPADNLTLALGATADLRGSVLFGCHLDPRAAPAWHSADTTIATVTTDGVVSALRAGATMLTATSRQDPALYARLVLTVPAGVCSGCTGPVSPSFVSLVIGESAQLQIAGVSTDSARASAYTFTSSSPSVATVSPTGLVTTGGVVGIAVVTVALRSDPRISYPVQVSATFPRGVRLTIRSVVGAADGLSVNPDSVAGEILVSVNVDRRADVGRTLVLSLTRAGGDSVTASAALPASSDTSSPIEIVTFRVNTAARDGSGRLRLTDGAHTLVVRVLEGATATRMASIQTRLILRNAP